MHLQFPLITLFRFLPLLWCATTTTNAGVVHGPLPVHSNAGMCLCSFQFGQDGGLFKVQLRTEQVTTTPRVCITPRTRLSEACKSENWCVTNEKTMIEETVGEAGRWVVIHCKEKEANNATTCPDDDSHFFTSPHWVSDEHHDQNPMMVTIVFANSHSFFLFSSAFSYEDRWLLPFAFVRLVCGCIIVINAINTTIQVRNTKRSLQLSLFCMIVASCELASAMLELLSLEGFALKGHRRHFSGQLPTVVIRDIFHVATFLSLFTCNCLVIVFAVLVQGWFLIKSYGEESTLIAGMICAALVQTLFVNLILYVIPRLRLVVRLVALITFVLLHVAGVRTLKVLQTHMLSMHSRRRGGRLLSMSLFGLFMFLVFLPLFVSPILTTTHQPQWKHVVTSTIESVMVSILVWAMRPLALHELFGEGDTTTHRETGEEDTFLMDDHGTTA